MTLSASLPETPDLAWHEGDRPYAQAYEDYFYCREDGRLECGHVFLAGNGLPRRWRGKAHFVIGELGFGTGLNFCETWRHWTETRSAGASLHFVSFERFPMTATDIGRALSQWPELAIQRQALCARWPRDCINDPIVIDFGDGMRLTVVPGLAHERLAAFGRTMDAWYLDGFAPSRNPDMWSAALMRSLFMHTAEEGTFATYAAAGFVRRNLAAAGFSVERRAGFGSKREMLCGVRQAPA